MAIRVPPAPEDMAGARVGAKRQFDDDFMALARRLRFLQDHNPNLT